MIIKTELLRAFMDKHKITPAILAQDIGIAETELNKLLGGEAVGEATARAFIYYFGADEAATMINWSAIGKKNPFDEG